MSCVGTAGTSCTSRYRGRGHRTACLQNSERERAFDYIISIYLPLKQAVPGSGEVVELRS